MYGNCVTKSLDNGLTWEIIYDLGKFKLNGMNVEQSLYTVLTSKQNGEITCQRNSVWVINVEISSLVIYPLNKLVNCTGEKFYICNHCARSFNLAQLSVRKRKHSVR